MKIIYFLLPILVLACTGQKTTPLSGTMHNSQSSLDWVGIYKGILPCADCEGISTMIQLNKDLTYTKVTQYQGKSLERFTQSGSFQWNGKGDGIILKPWAKEGASDEKSAEGNDALNVGKEIKEEYKVEEGRLVKLDENGESIKGDLAPKYVLQKAEFDKDIREKYWKLIELNGRKIVFAETQKRETHFVLRTNDKRVIGHGGCNAFSGNYELLKGNRIKFLELTSTEMFCNDVNYESDFFIALQTTDNYTINGDTLCLNKAKMAPMIKMVAVYFR
ncbi:MAG: copper resistance protein NlpE N-terminal domain-containing protein [Bacteroidia bacterium]|jgi:heat shock protein HslJ|nr:copper resistance protein NlpE N-terminal domain-containing protein [Bacteroidia bacterium]